MNVLLTNKYIVNNSRKSTTALSLA